VAPVLAEIGAEHDELTVVKVNIDENPKVAASYGVTSIPTLNVYSGGELVKSIVGAKPKPILLRELSNWLS
jgi:thioredoxin 1